MNIQIFGTKKCKETKKAERFFKERRIKFQSIDLNKKAMSLGELNSVLREISLEDLVDDTHPLYHDSLYPYTSDTDGKKGILQEYPELIKTPVVRNQKKATLGYQPDTWMTWINDDQ